jgi:hypothetical protein
MSTQEEDAIVGRLVRQRNESAKQLALIYAELGRISGDCKSLSIALSMMEFTDHSAKRTAEDLLKEIDTAKILSLVTEGRAAAKSRDEAVDRLGQLGIQS